jgi:hypothetical protein
MTGYEAFGIYQSLKLHFTQESYDFFKYNGKTNVSVNAFENRKDKYHFYKLSRKYTNKEDLTDFIVANLLVSDRLWVGDLLSEDADVRYKSRQKVLQSLSYVFENDCRTLFEGRNANDILKVDDGDYPVLLRKALRHEISIETICLLNKIINFIPKWDKQISDTIRWPDYRKKLVKYASFLPQDIVKYKLLLKKVIHD